LQQRQGKTLKTNRYLCLQVCQSTGLPSRDLYFATSRGSGDCIWKTTGEVISTAIRKQKTEIWSNESSWVKTRFLEDREEAAKNPEKFKSDRLCGDWINYKDDKR